MYILFTNLLPYRFRVSSIAEKRVALILQNMKNDNIFSTSLGTTALVYIYIHKYTSFVYVNL